MLPSFIFFAFILLNSCFICESACPNNTISWNSQCYKFFTNSTGFADAEFSRNQIGGHLASIHDGFTNTLLAEEGSKNISGSIETDFWIGANNLINHGNLSWTDGTTFDFNDWKSGEPQNVSGSNCVALSLTDGTWSAEDCFKNKPFVCGVPPAAPTNPTVYNCSEGWVYFPKTHSCYGTNLDLKGGIKNFTSAETYCRSLGADLPSIHSYEEDMFLRSYTQYAWTGTWIGFYSLDLGKNYIWTDGSPVDYVKWFN